jgi:hypothetical protein
MEKFWKKIARFSDEALFGQYVFLRRTFLLRTLFDRAAHTPEPAYQSHKLIRNKPPLEFILVVFIYTLFMFDKNKKLIYEFY